MKCLPQKEKKTEILKLNKTTIHAMRPLPGVAEVYTC